MGNYLALNNDVVWYVYRRTLQTDQWVKEPIQVWEGQEASVALRLFKHEVYAFSLGKYDYKDDTKAIYLYRGNERIAKVLLNRETNQVNVWSTMIREWVESEEQLPKLRYPVQQPNFLKRYHQKFAWLDSQTISYIQKEG